MARRHVPFWKKRHPEANEEQDRATGAVWLSRPEFASPDTAPARQLLRVSLAVLSTQLRLSLSFGCGNEPHRAIRLPAYLGRLGETRHAPQAALSPGARPGRTALQTRPETPGAKQDSSDPARTQAASFLGSLPSPHGNSFVLQQGNNAVLKMKTPENNPFD